MSGCNGSQNRSFFKKPVTQDSESVIKLEQICQSPVFCLVAVMVRTQAPTRTTGQLQSLISVKQAFYFSTKCHSLPWVFFFFLAFCSIRLLNKVRAANGDIREETQSRKHTSGVLFTPVLALVIFIVSYVYEYFACMYTVMCIMDVPGACRSKKRTSRFPGTTVSGWCGSWELNLGPLQEPPLQNSGRF